MKVGISRGTNLILILILFFRFICISAHHNVPHSDLPAQQNPRASFELPIKLEFWDCHKLF